MAIDPTLDKPVISLYGLIDFGLIIKASSGVLYTNQAGGNACLQPVTEGYLVPIDDNGELIPRLYDFFEKEADLLSMSGGISLTDAPRINEILGKCHGKEMENWVSPTFFLEVDQAKLETSAEAWLHMRIKACPEEHMIGSHSHADRSITDVTTLSGREWQPSDQPELGKLASLYPFSGFKEREAILTWPNSD